MKEKKTSELEVQTEATEVTSDSKEVESIVIRKDHKYCKWFWKGFYSFIGFFEKHIPHNILQFIKYSMLSACAGACELVTNMILNFALEGQRENLGMVNWIVEPIWVTTLIATLVGLVLGIIVNFIINRKFTFHSSGNVPRALTYVIIFYAIITPLKTMWNGYMPGFLVDVGMEYAGASTFINICGMFIIGFLEFCYQKFFVYRKEEGSALKDKEEKETK